MAKSAEAIDTVSLSETSEARSQVFNSFMDGIHQGFNPFQSCELASDRKTLRSDYYEARDQSVKAVWLALEEHEMCEDWASLRELPDSVSKTPDAISFQLAHKKGRDIEPNEINPDGFTTKGDPVRERPSPAALHQLRVIHPGRGVRMAEGDAGSGIDAPDPRGVLRWRRKVEGDRH